MGHKITADSDCASADEAIYVKRSAVKWAYNFIGQNITSNSQVALMRGMRGLPVYIS